MHIIRQMDIVVISSSCHAVNAQLKYLVEFHLESDGMYSIIQILGEILVEFFRISKEFPKEYEKITFLFFSSRNSVALNLLSGFG